MEKRMQIAVDMELYIKLRAIAKMERRSVSKQAWYYLRQCVADYESKNGEICSSEMRSENEGCNGEDVQASSPFCHFC